MGQKLMRVAVVIAIGAFLYALNRWGVVEAALEGVEALGPWAKPAFVLLQAVSVIILVPSVVPTFAAGVLFGLVWGVVLTVAGAALGAVAAFQIGRGVGRRWITDRFGQDRRFIALSRLAKRRGWQVVALARLTPIFPFAIGNYAFGLTPMRGWQYLGATALGTIPSNAVYVYLGTLTSDVAAAADGQRERSPVEWALLVFGLLVAGLLVRYLNRMAREALEDEEEPSASLEGNTDR